MAQGVRDLPQSAPRRHLHTRRVTSRGYLRDGGLWDIDGELVDEKTYTSADRERGPLPAGMPIHHMRARLTLDNEMRVVEAHAAMPTVPFGYCAGAGAGAGAVGGVSQLKGALVGAGWRRAVDAAMGATQGCTHMRELFYALATTAFQTASSYREQHMPELGAPSSGNGGRPFYSNQCHSWADTSPVVAVYFPQFHRKP